LNVSKLACEPCAAQTASEKILLRWHSSKSTSGGALKRQFRNSNRTAEAAGFPAHIHAVTAEGFLLKIALFIIAFTFDNLTT